jgi:hypothetical protein
VLLEGVVLRFGVQRLWNQYGGDTTRLWRDMPPSAAVVRRFLEFYGVGLKIATTAVNILVRQFKVPLRDYCSVDVSIDRQVRRVITRLGFVPEVRVIRSSSTRLASSSPRLQPLTLAILEHHTGPRSPA